MASTSAARASLVLFAGWLLVLTGCRPASQDDAGKSVDPAAAEAAARALFEHTTAHFHQPSATATGEEQRRLQEAAAAGYEELLRLYPQQEDWAAQSLRSLANIRAAQTNITEAVALYDRVARDYANQTWEVLLSLKSAADLLWDHDRKEEARRYYQLVVDRFDHPDTPQVVQAVVKGSQSRLSSLSVER